MEGGGLVVEADAPLVVLSLASLLMVMMGGTGGRSWTKLLLFLLSLFFLCSIGRGW